MRYHVNVIREWRDDEKNIELVTPKPAHELDECSPTIV
jgi:hypothetical protein